MNLSKKRLKSICFNFGLAVLVSVILTWLCINWLEEQERTRINKITIIGTILAVVALVLTLIQQIQLISVADAIKDTTEKANQQVKDIHFDVSLVNAIKCIDKIEDFLNKDTTVERVIIKLDDLHDYIQACIKCKEVSGIMVWQSDITRYRTLMKTTVFDISGKNKEQFSKFLLDLKNDLQKEE
jgi:hypothetical protein